MQQEIVTIGLSETGNDKLTELKEEGVFAEKMDGFRFAIALALAQGVIPEEIGKRAPFVNIGSLDPDHTLKHAVETLMPGQLQETTPYRLIERLGEWGINELYAQHQSGGIDFARVFAQVEERA
ncbi:MULTISPECIES: hypothetical protein [Rhizobium]|uniref:hypothetical protein n=1 Tax=Rhizobium TaxID=379 RepID=UPI00102F7916|nr:MULTISPECIES: hypothetical protein [Rhizobium]NEH27448.1 hypothetical protein [Rhizobium ruizarguesonis]TBF57611.1 hypothetical protein ELG87_14815 [Rhizobium leguminosarum]WSH56577.1 hypothetical protein U8P68_17170 [Rhizobium ruizarguesonis]